MFFFLLGSFVPLTLLLCPLLILLRKFTLPRFARTERTMGALDTLLRSQPTHFHLSGFSETRNAVFEGVERWACPRTANPRSGRGGSPLRDFLDAATKVDRWQKQNTLT